MTNVDLVNWTMQEARQLSPEHHVHGETKRAPSLEKLLEVLDSDRVRRDRARHPACERSERSV
jgi:hypothetical protein